MTDISPAPRPGLTRFAQRGSARLAYEPTARPTPGVPAIALLHDLLADRSALTPLRDLLTAGEAPSYRLVLPDIRGHGASAALADRRYTLADLAADLLAILDAEAIARPHLVGHGLGGAVAVAFARRFPDRVRSLILIEPLLPGLLASDPAPSVRSVYDAARDLSRVAADASYKGLTDRALDTVLNQRWGEGWRDRLPRPRLAAIRRHAGALAPLLTAVDNDAPTAGDLHAVTAPTLIVQIDNARPAERLIAERLASWLPNAKLATIPAPSEPALPLAGESGTILAELIGAFLDRGATSPTGTSPPRVRSSETAPDGRRNGT
jgi:pimeloyl-ACP methyl ester carboxylesterase